MIGWALRLADALRDRQRRKWWLDTAAAGRRGEDLAHRYLQAKGLTVVSRNWRPESGGGEIDLVAREGGTLVFVEVKSRTSTESGAPERNAGPAKEEAMQRVCRQFATRAGVPWERVRFDLVSVLLTNPPRIEHRKDAFGRIVSPGARERR